MPFQHWSFCSRLEIFNEYVNTSAGRQGCHQWKDHKHVSQDDLACSNLQTVSTFVYVNSYQCLFVPDLYILGWPWNNLSKQTINLYRNMRILIFHLASEMLINMFNLWMLRTGFCYFLLLLELDEKWMKKYEPRTFMVVKRGDKIQGRTVGKLSGKSQIIGQITAKSWQFRGSIENVLGERWTGLWIYEWCKPFFFKYILHEVRVNLCPCSQTALVLMCVCHFHEYCWDLVHWIHNDKLFLIVKQHVCPLPCSQCLI